MSHPLKPRRAEEHRPPFGRSPGVRVGRDKIPLRERFVEEYLIDLNATQAATRAGYSSKTAYAQGHRLLKDPKIAVAISAAAAARSVRVEVTQDTVLTELAILLRSDVRNFSVDEAGKLTLADGAPDDAWRAVSSVKYKTRRFGRGDDQETEHTLEFRLWDKPAAVKMAGQHLAMFTEKHELILPPGAGVLAVPLAPDALQWAAGAAAQQAALVARPSSVTPSEP